MIILTLLTWITMAHASDNLALLSGTLRTYQVAGCESQVVGLSCPPGTSISIREARYGSSSTAARTLCPAKTNFPSHIALPNNCQLPSNMQYSLLQTVVEACQKKRQCKIQTTGKSFGTDPCPGVSKYVEVAYKCRPYEFRSKVACENDVVQLKCNPNSRVAVYSASYGRTEYESVQCPQPQGVPEETCLVSYATETVMHICHGKRSCTLSADAATFGNPCRKESRMYLKVVYTCVHRKVLREQYEERPEADESLNEAEPPDFDSYDGLDESVYQDMFSPSPNLGRSNTSGSGNQGASRRPQAPQPTPPSPHSALPDDGVTWIVGNELQADEDSEVMKNADSSGHHIYPGGIQATDVHDDVQAINCTVNLYTLKESKVMGFITDWVRVHHFLSNNKERLYLYLVLSIGGGIVCLLALITARLLWQKHTAKRRESNKFDPQGSITLGTTSLSPDGFMDTISEVDADIDLTTINASINVIQSPPPSNQKNSGSVVRFGGGKNGSGVASGAGGQPHYYYG